MGRSAWAERELRSLGENCSSQSEEGEAKREWSVPPPGIPQPDTLISWGRQGLGAKAQALERGLGLAT